MTSIIDYLEQCAGAGGILEKIVLEHGRAFDHGPLAAGIRTGRTGECFANALHACWQVPELVYVEGFAIPETSWPAHHAWVVGPDGLAMDPTWLKHKKNTQYVGLPLALPYVERRVQERGYYGAISWDAPLDATQILDLGRPLAA